MLLLTAGNLQYIYTYIQARRKHQSDLIESRRSKLLELQTAVSEVMEALEATEEYKNTLILFLSDNGGRRVDTEKPEQGRPHGPN